MKRALLVFALLLAACGQEPLATDFHSGSDGITVAFDRDSLPAEVYEGSGLPVVVEVWNRGAYDLPWAWVDVTVQGENFYTGVSPDPELARLAAASQGLSDYDERAYFDGKGPYFPDGERLELRPLVEVKPVQGPRERPETQLFASVCYPYRTELGTAVCVDANAFNGNQQAQVCSSELLTFRDQGAPVAITRIENRPAARRTPQGALITQPVFVLHLQNVGGGSVLGAWTPETDDPAARADACALRLPYTETNKVAVAATLSNLEMNCTPNPVQLRDGTAFVTCTLPLAASGNLESRYNYQAAFTATLGYVYRDQATESFDIIRLPYAAGTVQDGGVPTDPTVIDGKSRCEYCSTRRGEPGCEGFATPVEGAFSCSCSERECQTRARDGSCLWGSWCPGTNYCCT